MGEAQYSCGYCHLRWSGTTVAHCGACHVTFTSPSAFDRHRTGGGCTHPLDAGLHAYDRVWGVTWGRPPRQEGSDPDTG